MVNKSTKQSQIEKKCFLRGELIRDKKGKGKHKERRIFVPQSKNYEKPPANVNTVLRGLQSLLLNFKEIYDSQMITSVKI